MSLYDVDSFSKLPVLVFTIAVLNDVMDRKVKVYSNYTMSFIEEA